MSICLKNKSSKGRKKIKKRNLKMAAPNLVNAVNAASL